MCYSHDRPYVISISRQIEHNSDQAVIEFYELFNIYNTDTHERHTGERAV